MRFTKLSLFLLITVLSTLAVSTEAYRSVDESGQVIFTDTPPSSGKKVEVIELVPGPSDKAVRDAQARDKEIRSQLESMRKQRGQEEQSRASKVKEAEKALEKAQSELSSTKALQDTDRQSLAGGKRKIRPEYFERVRKAEAAVEAAQDDLLKARSGR